MFDTWFASLSATEKSVTHPDNQMRKETYQLGIFFKKKKGHRNRIKDFVFILWNGVKTQKGENTERDIVCLSDVGDFYFMERGNLFLISLRMKWNIRKKK